MKQGQKIYTVLEVGKRWDDSIEEAYRKFSIDQLLSHQGPIAVDG